MAPKMHPGQILKTRFMDPLGMSASELARRCRMPRSRVSDIICGKRAISADTALRLAALFQMDPQAWCTMQSEWDLAQAEHDALIAPLRPAGFILGPHGAMAMSDFQPAAAPDRDDGDQRRTHTEVRYPDGTRAMVSVKP